MADHPSVVGGHRCTSFLTAEIPRQFAGDFAGIKESRYVKY
jgi:hypothetical protein